MYEYAAEVTRVVDGDTLDLRLDLGFTVSVDIRVRLYGVDTPEVYGTKRKDPEQHARGKAASEFVKAWAAGWGDRVQVQTQKGTGKYGRWLAVVYPPGGEGKALNELLIEAGHAQRYMED